MKYTNTVNYIISTLALVGYVGLSVNSVQASYAPTSVYGPNCQGSTYGTTNYGGGTPCPVGIISISKTVKNPQNLTYVENLTLNDPLYSAGDTVSFHITIGNSGTAPLTHVVMKDTIPQYLTFVKGEGNYDTNAKTVTTKIDTLQPSESRVFTIEAKFVDASNFPTNQSSFCVKNTAFVSSDNGQNGQASSQVCAQKIITTKGGIRIYPTPLVNQTPPTGPEAFPLLGIIISGIGGLFLRKRTK